MRQGQQIAVMRRGHGRIAGLVLALAIGGCATAQPEGVNDPIEPFNRQMFKVHLTLDEWMFEPGARTYRAVVPKTLRRSVHNALSNLESTVTLANDILQGEPDRAGDTALRLGINSTLGVAGLFDIASDWGIPGHSEDLGQTLAVYGVAEGPYLFLPVLGPSPPRDLAGWVGDFAFRPLSYVRWGDQYYWPYLWFGVNAVDLRERNLDTLENIERTSVDYYASLRGIYRQSRQNEIRNGEPDAENLPEF